MAIAAQQDTAVSVFGKLFTSCNGSNWRNNEGWPTAVQRMFGVTMDDAAATVVNLDLTNNNVIGQSCLRSCSCVMCQLLLRL